MAEQPTMESSESALPYDLLDGAIPTSRKILSSKENQGKNPRGERRRRANGKGRETEDVGDEGVIERKEEDVPGRPEPVFKPEYFFEHGLRKVKPYQFQFATYAKERWYGRTLLEVFSTEFRDRSPEYYEWAISSGVVVVNGQIASCSHIIRNGDLIQNTMHRHEPPVVGGEIKIVWRGCGNGKQEEHEIKEEDKGHEWMVIEKPGSMPVHPTGRYNYNTMLSILKYDYNLPMVYTANRLDRLTSGVMVVALSKKKSQDLGAAFQGGLVEKEYVARVVGEFPAEEVVCEEPMLTIDRQIGVNVVHPQGRSAKTIFNRMSYHRATNTSVVHCKPVTGRSHQIRVHLQFLGYPIGNDPIYNNSLAWGEKKGRGGVFRDPAFPGKVAAPSTVTAASVPPGTDDLPDPSRSFSPPTIHPSIAQASNPPPLRLVPSGVESPSPSDKQSPSRRLLPVPTTALLPVHPSNKTKRLKPIHPRRQDPSIDEFGSGTEVALSDEARAALSELRKAKDKDDDFARARDAKAAKLLKESENGHASATSGAADGGDMSKRGHIPVNGTREDDGYCDECGIPLIPDPRPDQLFIWLHALRYKTDEWDFSSTVLPEWAREDWAGT